MSMVITRAAAEIGDDALREVFARLPGLHDLLRCAATCKRWRRVVTGRDFLRRTGLWPDTVRHPCVLAGIFSQNYYAPCNYMTNDDPYEPPRFLSLQAGLDVHRRTFDSCVTVHSGNQRLFGHARPLAARRGFLLARVVLLSSSQQQGDGDCGPQKLNLAVCRPLLDRRSTQLLPPTPFNKTSYLDYALVGCAIITAADHTVVDVGSNLGLKHEKDEQMFQVLLIYKDDKNGFLCACTYSSDTPGCWSAPVKCCPASRLTRCGPRAGIVTNGTVHWLFKDNKTNLIATLNISVATSHVSLTNIPIKLEATLPRPPIPCIAGEEGSFSLVTIQDNGVANLWTKQEQDEDHHDCIWQNSQLTKLGNVRIDQVFFAESRGALLVEQGSAFSIIDLKNRKKMPLHLKDERTERLRGTRWFPAALCSSTCCGRH